MIIQQNAILSPNTELKEKKTWDNNCITPGIHHLFPNLSLFFFHGSVAVVLYYYLIVNF